MSRPATGSVADLRRGALADLRTIDFRAGDRDLWADEAALWRRMHVSWAGLDDAAWHVPGAAPSDGGGPDWSMAEHVGHIADWQEIAIGYVGTALATGRWPTDQDFDSGDFDTFNERRREPWASMPTAALLDRLAASRAGLLQAVRPLGDDVIRGHGPWGWIYTTLHGHYLDHLAVLEPWTARLRVRQTDGDPFVSDPRPADHADLLAQDDAIAAQFDALVRAVPFGVWETDEVTPGWTLRDHVGHLADWADEAVRAIDVYRRLGHWLADPDEGVDAWNERMVAAAREAGEDPTATLARFDRARTRLRTASVSLTVGELRSADGWSWVYDCLHGHIRKHLAMLGPWCAGTLQDDPR